MLVWHGIHAMFDALLFTGLAIVPLGLIPLGAAMLRAPGYGKPMSRTTIALGAATLAAATAVLVGGSAIMAGVGVLGLTGFHLALGWRTHRLAGTTRSTMLTGA